MAWPPALEKRYKLTVPLGFIFAARRPEHVRSNGVVDPPGVYEFAAVGYNTLKKKYTCVEASEHEDGGSYNFVLFTERQITASPPEGEPPRRFASIARSLPICDERGEPIVNARPTVLKQNATASEWPARLAKRQNLQVPRCAVFIMPRMGRNQGKDEFLGDHEFAVVGYNGRDEKYICIDAEDHQDASTDYAPHFMTEKQITSAKPSGAKPPAVRFVNIARPLPGCDDRGQLIADRESVETCSSPAISAMSTNQSKASPSPAISARSQPTPARSSSSAKPSATVHASQAGGGVREYDAWPKATKLLFELELERGYTFSYQQTATKASVEVNRYGWLVKEWGLNGEEAIPDVYEYIIAGFDAREGKYLCYEAGDNRNLAVRIHRDDIVAGACSPEAAKVRFNGHYPPIPEYDSRTLMVKGYERPTQAEVGQILLLNPAELCGDKMKKKATRESISEDETRSVHSANGGSPRSCRGRAVSADVGVNKSAVDNEEGEEMTLEASAPYRPWHQTSLSLYSLDLPRGLLFTYEQTEESAEIAECSDGDWFIKNWSANQDQEDAEAAEDVEAAEPGVYEYVIASYDPQAQKYRCFEPGESKNVVVLFSEEEINESLVNPLEADYTFGGKYPKISVKNEDPRTFKGKIYSVGGVFGFRRACKKLLRL